jgi:signal transduction histidine kinase/ActR/RegA family two-component response regulator
MDASRAAPGSVGGEAVLIHAPTGRDATLIAGMLEAAGHAVVVADSVERLCAEMGEGGGVALLAEEALTPHATRHLLDALAAQPSWSDFPLVVLTTVLAMQYPSQPSLTTLRAHGNVTLIERPVHPVTVLSAVQAGLRARHRQYQVRDYLLERDRTEDRVREAQKMEAVGQLAGGVAHEVNNMMTVVLGFGEFALTRLRRAARLGTPVEVDAVHSDVEEMVNAGRRAATITQQLLAFSRRQPRAPVLLRVQDVLPELGKLLRRLTGAGIELSIKLPDDLPPIRVDRTQFEQIIVNLVINARDAIAGTGRIDIIGECVRLDRAFADRHGIAPPAPGRWVQLSVLDTGRGMDGPTRARAFDPFFTTKPVGEGTGLGLSTVYGIVKQSGGYVWLDSTPGVGTTATIQLPEADGAPEERPPRAAAVRGGGETVLVVEDEPVVRRLARDTLADAGYLVLEANDGHEALELLARNTTPVDLVLSDVVMPRMGGREFSRALRGQGTDIPLLFMSGYPGQDVTDRGLLEPGAPFIQKPFSPDELAGHVRAILDARAAAQEPEKTGLRRSMT